MSAHSQRETVAFLERLLADPQLRADFRRRPATTCRAFGLHELAAELDAGTRGSVTLEQRESRSGMAGVMIAAAAEGVGLAGLLARQAADSGEAAAATAAQLVARLSADAATGSSTGADAAGLTPSGPASAAPAGLAPAPTEPAAAAAAPHAPATVSYEPGGLPAVAPAPGTTQPGGAAAAVAAPDPAGLPPIAAPPVAALPQSEAAPPATTVERPAAGGVDAIVQHAGSERPATAVSAEALEDAPAPQDVVAAAVQETVGSSGPAAYPGDGAPKPQIAAWMARRAAAAGIPEELPVMAALVESGLANLDHGDRDSVGFFQMRVGIWDEGAYRGFRDDPALQLQWFIDQATALRTERIAAGDVAFGSDPASWGTWIADIERPDERYRNRYGLVLDAARELLAARPGAAATADGATAAAAPPVDAATAAALAADVRAIDPSAAAVPAAERAITLAEQYLGDAYVWGGASPATGFDCSGLVQYVYGQAGVQLPRVTHEQFEIGEVVARDALRRGDLVFFRDSTGYIGHEGLYLGDGRFLHAPRTGDVVKVSSLDEPYFKQGWAGGRRVDVSAAPSVVHELDTTRREAGSIGAAREHDARVMRVLDPDGPRPGSGR